jgi:L-fucose isomerase-like protein
VFDELGAAGALERAWDYARAAALRARLRRARVGHVGHRVEGMTETTPHELALKRVLGPRVVGIDTHVFLERARAVHAQAVAGRWEDIKQQAGRVTASEEAGITAVQAYEALKGLIADHGLSAVAFGCYPNIFGVACLAASLLGEEGVPVACEGDVNGAVAMLTLTALTRQPVHCTDTLDPLPNDDAIVFSHCGSGGFSLASDPAQITLGPVRLMDHGLCCMFPARPGPVTMVNLIPALSGYRMAVACGEALETDMVFPGNPLKVRFTRDHRDVLAWIVDQGLGHHWMAAYGDLRRPLEDLARMVGCDWIGL